MPLSGPGDSPYPLGLGSHAPGVSFGFGANVPAFSVSRNRVQKGWVLTPPDGGKRSCKFLGCMLGRVFFFLTLPQRNPWGQLVGSWAAGVHKEGLSGVNNRREGQMWSGTAFWWVLLAGERG